MDRQHRQAETDLQLPPAGGPSDPAGPGEARPKAGLPDGAGAPGRTGRDPAGQAGTLMLLYDLYGGLLTANQRRIFRMRHHLDLSLAEIAGAEGISRQAVLDTLRRSQRVLVQAERRLHLLRRLRRQQQILAELKSRLASLLADGGRPQPTWPMQLRELHRLLMQLERAL